MRQRASRVSLAVLAYFLSSTASLAWVLHKAVPAGWEQRGFYTYVQFAANFWENVLPGEVALFAFLNFYLSSLAMVALATAALFLGRLSAAESQRMSHRLVKYTVFKTVFLGCVITNDPRDVALWLAWFALLGYLRVFLGAAKDRLEGLLTAPGARVGRHVRAVGLLLLLGLQDGLALMVALRLLWPPPAASSPSLPASPSPPSPPGGSSRVLLCVFDCAVVAVEAGKTLLRYVVHMGDRLGWTPPAYNTNNTPGGGGDGSGNMADGTGAGGLLRRLLLPPGVGCLRLLLRLLPPPGSLLYHVELVADVAVHLLTLAHYLHVWVLHGLSFHLIDVMLFLDMRSVLSSLLRRLRTHLAYRAATHRLDTCFKDVYPHQQHQQLAAAGGGTDAAAAAAAAAAHSSSFDCTICMEEIGSVGKQLPCGHIFHLACLRAWLQQAGSESFTCPNCRTPLLVQQQQQGEGHEEEGAEGGGGARLRRRGGRGGGGGGLLAGWRWWLGGLVERAYVRVVVALEPLLLSLLVLILDRVVGLAPTGRPAPPRPHQQQQQQPRRHLHPHPHPHAAATSLEGFGESPGPLPPPRAPHPPINPGAGGAATRLIRRGTGQSAGRSGGGGDGGGADTLGVSNRWQEAREEGYPSSDCFEDDSDDGDWYGDKDDDGDVSDDGGEGDDGGRGGGGASHDSRSREGAAAAVRQQRRREGAAAAAAVQEEQEEEVRHGRRGRSAAGLWGCSSGGPELRPTGHFDPHHHRGTAAAAAAAAAGAPGPSSAAWQAAGEDEGEEGGMYGGRRSQQRRQQRSGDPSLRGPRGQRGLLPPLPPAAAEVPTFSGDVLPREAAAAVRRLGRTLSTSLRSSWGAGGVCAGAVGGGEDSEGGDEVSSRPRHAHPRSSQLHNRRQHPQHRNQLLQPQQQQQQEEEQEEE